MEKLYLPQKILEIIKDKNFEKDEIGMSDSSVLIFDDMVLKIQPCSKWSKNEHVMMDWLKNKISVPECILNLADNGMDYLLMSKISGKMSCDDEFMNNPKMLVFVLADAIKQLWKIDVTDCPVVNDLNTLLSAASYRVENDLVDVSESEPETFGKGGFKSPEELLLWLYDNRPKEDFVLSHGDFSLPNVFIDGNRFSGFVDIGKMGVADRYRDIAICYRSLHHNFEGIYTGKSYIGYDDSMLFSSLGIEPDFDKIRYYILLDELF